LPKLDREALSARLQRWFSDREFFMRADGQVRFIRISGKLQRRVAVIAGGLTALWLGTIVVAAGSAVIAVARQDDLRTRVARVESAEQRVAAYRQDLGKVADDLRRRQDFIAQMVKAHVGELPVHAGPGPGSAAGTGRTAVEKISAAVPEAAPLARLEASQLAFVEALTRLADRRSAEAAATMRELGLNPARLSGHAQRDGMGGPLLRLSTSADGSLDPRFRRLGLSLARMNALQQGLERIPQALPASSHYISSGFGSRIDPIAGGAAFHPGLDFKGPIGAPVYAAAKGRVVSAGARSGYGNCVEIDHGNGMVTRYAHLSAFRTRVGATVATGTPIGAIGSTGRSTGPHLHFEVRINDQPVNPRPFLEAAPHVLEKTRGNRNRAARQS